MSFFHGTIMALQNLTRIYVWDIPWNEEKFGRSTAYFPIVGLIIGIFLYAIYASTLKFYQPFVGAALILGGQLIVTGGMHLDGFMDSMDGLFSGREKERKLEIMKDSRVGANGVMTLVILMLLKYSLLVSLGQTSMEKVLLTLVMMATLSRWSMVYAIRMFSYLPEKGLGKLYKLHTGNKELAIASFLAIAIILAEFILVGGLYSLFRILLVMLAVVLLTYFMAKQITKTIGGMTGDTYGAIAEIMEVAILLMALINF